jgi:hypothetical protein
VVEDLKQRVGKIPGPRPGCLRVQPGKHAGGGDLRAFSGPCAANDVSQKSLIAVQGSRAFLASIIFPVL